MILIFICETMQFVCYLPHKLTNKLFHYLYHVFIYNWNSLKSVSNSIWFCIHNNHILCFYFHLKCTICWFCLVVSFLLFIVCQFVDIFLFIIYVYWFCIVLICLSVVVAVAFAVTVAIIHSLIHDKNKNVFVIIYNL